MSQLEIQILHQDYLLTCPDGHEAQLMEAVERVDQQFQQMRDTSKLRSRERIGVLLAVNLAYENLELRSQLQALQQQVANIQSPADAAEVETDAERLQALEAQALCDQEAANALLERLDSVLAEKEPATQVLAAELVTTETPASLPAEEKTPDAEQKLAPEHAPLHAEHADAVPITNSNDIASVGLTTNSPESL